MKGRFENSKPIVKVLQWLGVMGVLTLVAFFIYALLPHPQSISSLKTLQLLQTLGTFLLPALLMAYLWSEKPMQWLHLDKTASPRINLLAVAIMIVAIPAINLLAHWNEQLSLPAFLAPMEATMKAMEEKAAALTEQFMQVDTIGGLLLNLGLMALLPAVAEEMSFRGVLQGLFTSPNGEEATHRRAVTAIWASAILFSAMHMQFYGFIPRMLMGAMFGYVLYRTGSLWMPILMHFTNNAIATIGYYIVYQKGIDPDSINAIGTNDTLWLGIGSLCATGLLLYYLAKQCSGRSL